MSLPEGFKIPFQNAAGVWAGDATLAELLDALGITAAVPGVVLVQGAISQHLADVTTPVPCTGDPVQIALAIADPPDYMDDAGHITAPGLYEFGVLVSISVAMTTPHKFLRVNANTWNPMIPLDSAADDAVNAICEITSLTESDVPYLVPCTAVPPVDATGVLGVRPIVKRLLAPSA